MIGEDVKKPASFPQHLHHIQETSRESYREERQNGNVLTCCERVYVYITAFPKSSDREIAKASGMTINNVTARRNELCKGLRVKCVGKKIDPGTGKLVLAWADANYSEQTKLTAFQNGVMVC